MNLPALHQLHHRFQRRETEALENKFLLAEEGEGKFQITYDYFIKSKLHLNKPNQAYCFSVFVEISWVVVDLTLSTLFGMSSMDRTGIVTTWVQEDKKVADNNTKKYLIISFF